MVRRFQRTLWTIDLTFTLGSTSIYRLQDINHILPVPLHEIHLVVITCSEIAHDVFISKEEHDCEGFFIRV